MWDWPKKANEMGSVEESDGGCSWIMSQDNTLCDPLGQWVTTKGHQRQECVLDGSGTLNSRDTERNGIASQWRRSGGCDLVDYAHHVMNQRAILIWYRQ
jgi:hypothetical protein